MRYAQITPFEICNGKGAGVSLFTQGCHFQCKGCFNQNAWDFNGGKEWNDEIKNKFFELINRPYIKRVSILGGEPLANANISEVYSLCKEIKEKFPTKNIWLYTGYMFEDIDSYLIMKYIDVLVDGRYIDKLKDLTLKFKGSSNQRVIDIQKTFKENKIVLYN